MTTEITKTQLLVHQLSRIKDKGNMYHVRVFLAKGNNVYQTLAITRLARNIIVANGIVSEYQTMRHMGNLESVKTGDGTRNIHILIIGNFLNGIEAFI